MSTTFEYNADTKHARYASRFGGELLVMDGLTFGQAREIALAIGGAEALAIRATRKALIAEMHKAVDNVDAGG